MGCCQSQLSTTPYPINKDRKMFVDGINQQSLENQEDNAEQNYQNQFEKDKKIDQKQEQTPNDEQYEFSIHDYPESLNEQSQVSIMKDNPSNKSFIQTKSKKKLHVQIHPDVIEKQNYKQTIVQKQKQGNNQQISQNKCIFNDITNNNSIPSLRSFKQQVYASQSRKSSQEELFLKLGSNNKDLLSLKSINNQPFNSNQTSRDLLQLHDGLSTMIVLWDRKGNTSRLRLETMTLNEQDNKYQDEEVEQKDQQMEEELKNIWGDEDQLKQQSNIKMKQINKKQDNSLEVQQKLKQLKKEFIIQNIKSPIIQKTPHNNNLKLEVLSPSEQCVLSNQKIKEQIMKNKNPQPKNEVKNVLNQKLRLHLSQNIQQHNQSNNFSPHHQNQSLNSKSQKNNSQSQSQYSKCPLSDPTRFLNQSLVQQINQQKELFYFGKKDCKLQNNLKKWTQHDRNAYQVKDNDILQFVNKSETNSNNLLLPMLLSVIKRYKQMNGINLLAYKDNSSHIDHHNNQCGFRIFFNGIKRLYSMKKQKLLQNKLHSCIQQIFQTFNNAKNKQIKTPPQILYNLTGWIPQEIIVEEVTNFQGVFQRLNNNFKDGNTMITFTEKVTSKQNCVMKKYWGLKNIDLTNKSVHVYGQKTMQSSSHPTTSISEFQQIYTWQQFIQKVSSINVNWNPLIYDFSYRSQNLFLKCQQANNKVRESRNLIQKIDNTYIGQNSCQYLIKIPSNQEDIELRVFLETHQDIDEQRVEQDIDQQPLVVDLYDANGFRINSSTNLIRTLNKNKKIFSDVLIFQASKQKNQYTLVVRPADLSQNRSIQNKTIKYTISLYSFFQIGFSQIPKQKIISQKLITTYLQQSHCGYGINSPHFLNNFYLQLKVPPLQRIKIFVEMPDPNCQFQLNLIGNPKHQQNLTRLNLENILENLVTSQQFVEGKGYLDIQETKFQQYFFVITNNTKCKGQFKIVVQILEKQIKCLDEEKLTALRNLDNQSHQKNNKQQQQKRLIQCKQRFYYQQPQTIRQFKWSPLNTGPRKRLKSNTHSGFQQFSVFKQFFKNPYIDIKFDKKSKYQFSVINQTYTEIFDQLQQIQQKKDVQPPTLSLSILKIKRPDQYSMENQRKIQLESLFQIVLDDAFYVPFGFGFWTKIMEVEEGQYRFVFPKMQKQGGSGKFYIYQVKDN